MGSFYFKDEFKHVFVSRAKPIRFGNCDVFQAEKVIFYGSESFFPDMALSEDVQNFFAKRFLFSYQVDLSDNSNFDEAFVQGGNPLKCRANWMFFVNRNILQNVNEWARPWLLPIVYGQICRIPSADSQSEVVFLIRKSVFDLCPAFIEDRDVHWDFYSPSSAISIDCFVIQGKNIDSVSITLNNFPGSTPEATKKMVGDSFSNEIKSARIHRYFEFMYYFFNTRVFVFNGPPERVSLMRSVQKKVKNKAVFLPAENIPGSHVSGKRVSIHVQNFPPYEKDPKIKAVSSYNNPLSLDEIIKCFYDLPGLTED